MRSKFLFIWTVSDGTFIRNWKMNLNRFDFSDGDGGGRTLLIKSLSSSHPIIVCDARRILCAFTQLLFRYICVWHLIVSLGASFSESN